MRNVFKWIAIGGGALAVLKLLQGMAGPRSVGKGILVDGAGSIPPGGMFMYTRSGGVVHKGIDIFAKEGTPVFAARMGTVEWSGPLKGFGELVVIRHDDTTRAVYAHLSQRSVRLKQRVSQGQLVGEVGRTAYGECGKFMCKDPAHLHFEVITDEGAINKSRRRTDPLAWLPKQGVKAATALT